jgi:hypothetical protein
MKNTSLDSQPMLKIGESLDYSSSSSLPWIWTNRNGVEMRFKSREEAVSEINFCRWTGRFFKTSLAILAAAFIYSCDESIKASDQLEREQKAEVEQLCKGLIEVDFENVIKGKLSSLINRSKKDATRVHSENINFEESGVVQSINLIVDARYVDKAFFRNGKGTSFQEIPPHIHIRLSLPESPVVCSVKIDANTGNIVEQLMLKRRE